MAFYNEHRPDQALGYRTPIAVWRAATGTARCGHDGQRRRVAHMPTAATTADDGPCGMIVGEGAVIFQLRNRFKRSRYARPFHAGPSSFDGTRADTPEILIGVRPRPAV
ncbi:hypothetical protein [Bradyrhizobium sp. CCBAU 051011]|uniref:hypothetical protein n=1 Tax=Bradyrhizobium sp. CCBAU 051011 TaxID=858422 RepID=UPI00352B0EB3